MTRLDDSMDLLEQPQVVCTIKLWYKKISIGIVKVWGILYALHKALKHEYIIVNSFVNILSIFKSLEPKRKVFNGLYLYRKTS